MKIITKTTTINHYIHQHHLEDIFDARAVSSLQLHSFEANERIIYGSNDIKYLYLVLEGESRVTPSSEEGKVGLLDFIKPMDIIGDLEYFLGDAYYHHVDALSPCILLAIPRPLIEHYLNQHIQFYQFICQNMASKMKRTSARYASSLLYPLKTRLATYLYDLYQRTSSTELPLSATQIASYLGVTPRHLRRLLQEFEEKGVLSRTSSKIQLIQPDQLLTYTSSLL